MQGHGYAAQRILDVVRGRLVRVESAPGTLVRVASGAVWITEEGDRRDRFVSAGGGLRIATSGVALISALTPHSVISVSSPLRVSRLLHALSELSAAARRRAIRHRGGIETSLFSTTASSCRTSRHSIGSAGRAAKPRCASTTAPTCASPRSSAPA